jgi:LDH2 family malate/lactate/ureidoglycolate dehydrogenase
MAERPVVVSAERLREFLASVLAALKTPPAPAALTADLMVRTDLRGVDSHGVGMLPKYVEWTEAGFIHPWAEAVVARDDGATALLDGQRAFGHPTAVTAMRLAIDKARAHGVGLVAVRNSSHFGACANYSMMALEHGMIGLAFTNSPFPAMVPTFGRAPMMGTNPLSLAAPAATHAPFVLDMATTTVAVGKLHIANRWKKPIPEGWALDEAGRPTTDPQVALAARRLSPLGGSRELGGHKGYGLGVLVDILSGVLAGGVYGTLFFRSGREAERHLDIGHCFAALDIARFRPLAEFEADMDDLLRALNDTPTAPGQARVLTAGEPEAEIERERARTGIPLAPALVGQLDTIAARLGVRALGAGGAAPGRDG